MKTIVQQISGLLVLLSLTLSAQRYQDTLISYKNLKLEYEYDLSWSKEVKKTNIDQFIKSQSEPSFKASSQIKTILQNIAVSQSPCLNSGFDTGYNGWTGLSLKHGIQTLPIENGLILNPGIQPLPFTGLSSGQNHTSIETAGLDALLLASSPPFSMSKIAPGSLGTQSLRLGNDQPGFGAEGVAKRFFVTAANSRFYFKYAIVMDRSHSNSDGSANGSEAFFIAEAVDMSGVTIDKIVDIAAPANPFISQTTHPSEGIKYYRNWRCAYLDLSNHIGKEVVVMFINADCSAGGHNGYTYLDDTCTTCVNESEGAIDLDLKGHDCIDPKQTFKGTFTVPAQATNVQTSFQIYQSGTLINTLPATTIAMPNYTVDVSATDFPNQTPGTCYDVVAKLTFTLVDLNGNLQTVVQYSTNPVLGIQYGQVAGFNNDVCFCKNNLGSYCCDTENLVQNGNFEAGNTGFTSAYTLNSATFPGQYNVTNSASNFGASVTDHSFCADPVVYVSNSMYLTVNGKTQQTGSSIIYEQTITGLKQGQAYRYCANFKNMKQCTYDILPKVRLVAGTTSSALFTVNQSATNPCAWQTNSMYFTASSSTMTIRIYLDETGNGDGNDLAIDDVFVGALKDPGLAISVQHTGSTSGITASIYTISSSDDSQLGRCKYYWYVAEVSSFPSIVIDWSTFASGDSSGSNLPPFASVPSATPWALTTNFPGYTFAPNKMYLVGMYTPECGCSAADFTYQLTFNIPARTSTPQVGLTEQQKTAIIDAILNGLNVEDVDQESITTVKPEIVNDLDIFPNPAKTETAISVRNGTVSKVSVSDSNGKVILDQSYSAKNSLEKVNISKLNAGLYFINVTTSTGKIYTVKMIKS